MCSSFPLLLDASSSLFFQFATSVMQCSICSGSRSARGYEMFFTRIVKLVCARKKCRSSIAASRFILWRNKICVALRADKHQLHISLLMEYGVFRAAEDFRSVLLSTGCWRFVNYLELSDRGILYLLELYGRPDRMLRSTYLFMSQCDLPVLKNEVCSGCFATMVVKTA